MTVFKKRPELLDLIARRGVDFQQWCKEHSVSTWDELLTRCRELDVIPPGEEYESQLPLTKLPLQGFSPEVREELKVLLDEAHDKAEIVMITIPPETSQITSDQVEAAIELAKEDKPRRSRKRSPEDQPPIYVVKDESADVEEPEEK